MVQFRSLLHQNWTFLWFEIRIKQLDQNQPGSVGKTGRGKPQPCRSLPAGVPAPGICGCARKHKHLKRIDLQSTAMLQYFRTTGIARTDEFIKALLYNFYLNYLVIFCYPCNCSSKVTDLEFTQQFFPCIKPPRLTMICPHTTISMSLNREEDWGCKDCLIRLRLSYPIILQGVE